jgi:hypothetical protein
MKIFRIVTYFLFLSSVVFGQVITISTIDGRIPQGIPVTVEHFVPGQTGYTQGSVPYAYESTSGTSLTLGDDQTISNLPIGFTFNYWGTNFTTVNICSNGWISFTNTGGDIVGGSPNNTVRNGIHANAMDLFPISGYFVRYQTTGSQPNRRFIVSYHIGYYNCRTTTTLFTDFQIVLSETTNTVRINLLSHPGCASLSSLQGISNSDNSQIITTPGRNGSNWSGTSNSSVLFTPFVQSSTWIPQGTILTNTQGNSSFSNPQNYTFRATINSSQYSNTIIESELNYLLFMKTFPSEMRSWDFYTCDITSDSTTNYFDIKSAWNIFWNNSTLNQNLVFSNAEKLDIEQNSTSPNYYLTRPLSHTRTFENTSLIWIVSKGKHRTTTTASKIQD